MKQDSYYKIILKDSRTITSEEMSWKANSDEVLVNYNNKKRLLYVSRLPILKIFAFHDGLHSELKVKEGEKVYQSMISETIVVNEHNTSKVLARVIGLVKDGKIIEEKILDGRTSQVIGFRI